MGEYGEMGRQLFASAAAIALFAVFDGAGVALAQDAGGTSGTTQNPPAAADQAPAADAQAPAASGGNLPEVKVIQQQAKPKPVKQAQKKPKPQPAPQPVAATAPETPPETSTSEGPPADVERELPHRTAAIGAFLGHLAELIGRLAGEFSGLVRILECCGHRHQRCRDDIGDKRIVDNLLQALRRGRDGGIALFLLVLFLFLLVLAHAIRPFRIRNNRTLIPISVTRL